LRGLIQDVDACRGDAHRLTESTGVRHSVEVAAESLYEAAALAVKEFRAVLGLRFNPSGSFTSVPADLEMSHATTAPLGDFGWAGFGVTRHQVCSTPLPRS
jgi:hypothetical protein